MTSFQHPNTPEQEGRRARVRFRAVVQDLESTPEYIGPCDSLEEAQQLLRDEMDGADPPYDSGWVEFQEVPPWNHISAYTPEQED